MIMGYVIERDKKKHAQAGAGGAPSSWESALPTSPTVLDAEELGMASSQEEERPISPNL